MAMGIAQKRCKDLFSLWSLRRNNSHTKNEKKKKMLKEIKRRKH